ncbi:peroxidase 5, partial [Cajanus cajan]
ICAPTLSPNDPILVAALVQICGLDRVALSDPRVFPHRRVSVQRPTGRRDDLLSDPSLVNLPSPSFSIPGALQFFATKGLTLADMVTLLGAHTIGFAHCSVFQNRLTNVRGGEDPTMDPVLAATLVQICGLDREALSDPRVF